MPKWTEHEDAFLREHSSRMSVKKLATELHRGEDAVKGRQVKLGLATETPGVPLSLGNDDRLVKACLAEGGFPRAVVHAGITYWLGHDGYPWRSGMVQVPA